MMTSDESRRVGELRAVMQFARLSHQPHLLHQVYKQFLMILQKRDVKK